MLPPPRTSRTRRARRRRRTSRARRTWLRCRVRPEWRTPPPPPPPSPPPPDRPPGGPPGPAHPPRPDPRSDRRPRSLRRLDVPHHQRRYVAAAGEVARGDAGVVAGAGRRGAGGGRGVAEG